MSTPVNFFDPEAWDDTDLVKAFDKAVTSYQERVLKKKPSSTADVDDSNKSTLKKRKSEQEKPNVVVAANVMEVSVVAASGVPFPPAPEQLQELLYSYYWAGFQAGRWAERNK